MTLYTIGHGTSAIEEFVATLKSFEIASLVDVRRFPGSRRNPQFGFEALAQSLDDAKIAYRNVRDLGGRRRADSHSPNVGLRNEAFRGYADYMGTQEFRAGFDDLMKEADSVKTAIMCSETVWWRCHRRLISDAAVILALRPVEHILGGATRPHIPTEGVTRDGDYLRYPAAPVSV